DELLFELEVGNAVAQQTAGTIVLLENGDGMSRPCQLLRTGQASRARADDGNLLAGLARRAACRHPAFFPCAIGDGVLDGLDADRIAIDIERTCRFARCRADAPGELGEVVGQV